MSIMSRFTVMTVRCSCFCAVLFLLFSSSDVVRAQLLDLKSWEIDKTLETKKADAFNALKSGGADAAAEKFFDAWYFARWTALEEIGDGQKVSAAQTQQYVRELFQDFRDLTGNAREAFLKRTFETLQKMAADEVVHPSARYNAVLAIGQLAQRESGGRTAPPALFAASLPWLIEEYKKEKNPEYVKLAALIGIVRHARTGIADETLRTATVPELLLSIVDSGKPDPKVAKENQEIKDWFRHLALEGFSGMRTVGPGGKVVGAIEAVMGNSSESLEMRTKAARVLGDLDYATAVTAGITLNFQRLGTTLVTLMKTVADEELQSVKQLRDKSMATQGRMTAGPGLAESDPAFDSLPPEQQIEIESALQNVKMNVQNVAYGLRGTRLTGTTTQGVFPMLSSDDAVTLKVTATMTKGVTPLIRKLDEGPPEDQKNARRGMDSSEMMSGSDSGMEGRKTKPKDEKKIKVNLLDIRNALQEFSTEMGAIVSGSET